MINNLAKVVMWTNKNICIEGKSCLYPTLYGKGIVKLKDLVEFSLLVAIWWWRDDSWWRVYWWRGDRKPLSFTFFYRES